MIKFNTAEIVNKLLVILRHEEKLKHLELNPTREQFIRCIIDRIGIDPEFDEIVGMQLSLWIGDVDSRTFYNVCNEPKHKIRNKLIAWYIDHPEEKK